MIKISINDVMLFGKNLPFYGILFLIGFASGALLIAINKKKTTLPGDDILYAGIFAGLGGIIGAKLLSILTSINIMIEYKLSLQEIIQNGFVFYGGLIGGFSGLILYSKIYKLPTLSFLDLFSPAVPLGHALGRIGCLFSGCCYGQPTSGWFSVIYLKSLDPNTPLNTPLIPIQLIESLCLLLIFALCQIVFRKSKKPGLSALLYFLFYAVVRFVLEFFRGDMIRGVYVLSTSQYISIAIIVCCTVWQLILKNKRKHKNP